MTRAVRFLGFLVVAGTACDSAERRDAQTVAFAVTRFRTADNASTPAMVEALKATPCAAPDACRARDVCASAGDATAKALRLKADVEKSLAALEKGALPKDSPEAQGLPKKLEDAETLLRQGRDGLPRCDEELVALKRKHRI